MEVNKEKILGEKRRNLLLQWLRESSSPLTGSRLAERTNVSRQVIVQDISLLKARNYPILATAQGYMLIPGETENTKRKKIVCFHEDDPAVTAKELNLIVDHGATVIDVSIEHPLYGDITASLMLSSRRDVKQFIDRLSSSNAGLLSALTDGTHLHTIEAASDEVLDEVVQILDQEGFLLK
ncbi:transcription repressor NadR [Bacillus sp. FJAT-44742]|uniref:transcription repressor NadR n=1 Tax=Bacillus sp. FJAT-44742 TaxID=2014005 RepID=UPI003FA45F93